MNIFFWINLIAVLHSTCVYEKDGKEPEIGECSGPTERVLAARNATNQLNEGCPLGTVPFFLDGQESETVKCGQCKPGVGGMGLENAYCSYNEYCTDEGKCSSITLHPVFGKECPYFDFMKTVDFCGGGMECIQHKCLQCQDGEIQAERGLICYKGVWTKSKLISVITEPNNLFLGIISFVFLFEFFIQIVSRIHKVCSKDDILKVKKKSKIS
ncbi:uncharacterized protein MONOS_6659 [Monocercomonoides exilis]|uniref:uncharacterized protein n=1 Tax=Monocercomonoides exilis TaxID=2049356 RepID=UPI00355972FF|nr:hypothetical protein MONOS_6659 [Monocercomonoides exilis]|eukprot:MONOS_6659.1-p1 / transcript=MONOS_6659.1 / gene=MONOS_6659 / organism=Monocercomonoides_exilis_PA203 / gene_product=unspecified product / transcript_product=unspecified product / location=Mono_scaffold00214:8701-9532(-) / protein_length=213 / sequence_SO=supercontig / SO=protein_coding / is_pseudo=false